MTLPHLQLTLKTNNCWGRKENSDRVQLSPLRIPNLPPGEQGPTVTTKGRSCLPYCHFDLKDSNYISGHRRAIDLRGPGGGPLDPATRVIEFNSVGIGGKTIQ